MNSNDRIFKIMDILREQNPNPKCELKFCNEYTLLVAVLLSAQATDKGVNKATEALFAVADSPSKMLDLGEEKLKSYIKTIGLFNNKAKNIIRLSTDLQEKFKGEVPLVREELEKLSGVGRKTANVVLNVWLGQPTIAVDTHVFRVAHRLEFSNGKTPIEVEKDLSVKIPPEFHKNLNHWLVLFGRYVCKAKNPACRECPIADFCNSSDKKL